jgi:hypothetical protein
MKLASFSFFSFFWLGFCGLAEIYRINASSRHLHSPCYSADEDTIVSVRKLLSFSINLPWFGVLLSAAIPR